MDLKTRPQLRVFCCCCCCCKWQPRVSPVVQWLTLSPPTARRIQVDPRPFNYKREYKWEHKASYLYPSWDTDINDEQMSQTARPDALFLVFFFFCTADAVIGEHAFLKHNTRDMFIQAGLSLWQGCVVYNNRWCRLITSSLFHWQENIPLSYKRVE